LCRELLRRIPATVLGHPARIPRAWFDCLIARWRYGFWWFDEQRQLAAFKDFQRATARLTRLTYIAHHGGGNQAATSARGEKFVASDLRQSTVEGYSMRESWKDRSLRWTAPVAIARFELAPDNYKVAIDTGSIRGHDCDFPFALFLNGEKIPDDSISVGHGHIRFTIRREMFHERPYQELTMVASPIGPSRVDNRRLGIPVCAIGFQSHASVVEAERRAA